MLPDWVDLGNGVRGVWGMGWVAGGHTLSSLHSEASSPGRYHIFIAIQRRLLYSTFEALAAEDSRRECGFELHSALVAAVHLRSSHLAAFVSCCQEIRKLSPPASLPTRNCCATASSQVSEHELQQAERQDAIDRAALRGEKVVETSNETDVSATTRKQIEASI